MNKIFEKINLKLILIFLFLSSIAALSGAYISQYVFGLMPCPLCLYQRIPFFIVAFLALIVVFTKTTPNWQKIIIKIALFILFLNAILALYHVGVEQKIFIFDKCADMLPATNTLEELHQQILQTKAVRCDEPQLIVFGISMAGWNVIYCLFVVLISLFSLKKIPNTK